MTKKTKIKLNASKRKLATKVFERHYQNEDNIYKQEYSSCRQKVDFLYPQAHERTKVSREAHYPTADIQNLAEMQKRYNLDIVNPDACFHVRTKLGRTQKDWEGREQEVFDDCHVNFQLFGGLSGNGYSERGGYNFAVAYYHQHLTQKGCIPQIHVMQKGKKDNPYLTQKKDENIAELGGRSTNPENLNGLSLQWHDKYKLNVIMRSHYCNSRYLTCDRSDYDFFKDFYNYYSQLTQKPVPLKNFISNLSNKDSGWLESKYLVCVLFSNIKGKEQLFLSRAFKYAKSQSDDSCVHLKVF